MNALHIIGNLTANPESRIIKGERGPQTVCNFTVAVNRFKQGKKITDYFRITLWNKQAENAMKYLAKGRHVSVSGPVTGRAYIGNTDGKAHVSLEIQDVQEIEYLSGKPEEGAQENQSASGGYQDEGYVPVDDQDLPWQN